MGTISIGSRIKIPCEVKPGPFSEERLVSFDTLDGVISGFVRDKELTQSGDEWYISGVIRKVESEHLIVMVRGSFFTTNGIASISKSLAYAA